MANWKKVLVSGSDIHVAQISASNVPESSDTSDRVIVRDATNGGFKSVTQTSIVGQTTANFKISGSTGHTTFAATTDTLIFTSSNDGVSTTVTDDLSNTTVTVNLPAGTISSSQQINLTQTVGFGSFSSSIATDISGNLLNTQIATASIASLETTLADLVITASLLAQSSQSIANALTSQTASIQTLSGSVASLNDFTSSAVTNADTGSFVISSSVIGTAQEIEVTPNGLQGLTIGLPENVVISGLLEADSLIIQGENVTETGVAIISGSTIFGDEASDLHKFTGSLQITGALEIDNTGNTVAIKSLDASTSATVSDLIVHQSDGTLKTAGTAINAAITGAFGLTSASFEDRISNIDTTTSTTNGTDITALQNISESLVTSASQGIFIEASGDSGTTVSLGNSASFVASGQGLSVGHTTSTNGVNSVITYTINPSAVGEAITAFSSSTQLTPLLDPIYVNASSNPISSSGQLVTLGFLTASDFNTINDVPPGLISSSTNGGSQGQFLVNGQAVSINGLTAASDVTFNNVTVANLTVTADTTALQTEQLNIEDQFILINSGAGADDNDKDGGIIVDNGGGSGSLFMYDFDTKAWGFKGAGDSNKVNFDDDSDIGLAITPEVFVATVSSSNVNPSPAPLYGIASSTAKGQMHVNTSDSTIWIYA